MNKSKLVVLSTALMLVFSTAAFATGNNHNRGGHQKPSHVQGQAQGQIQGQVQKQAQGQSQFQQQSANATSLSVATSAASANNSGVKQSTVVGGSQQSTTVGGNQQSVEVGGAQNNFNAGNSGNVIVTDVKQYPVPGEIQQPGLLNTPNNDKAGPYYYDKAEMVMVQYVFTLTELMNMTEGYKPEVMGDLTKKKVLPKSEWSGMVAFYLEIPAGLKKTSIKQVGMLTVNSDSKKIPSPALFGAAGMEAAKRGANAVIVTGDGWQREDKAFSVGPGASVTGPTGTSVATVALPVIYAERWKDDYPWAHFTIVNVPLQTVK